MTNNKAETMMQQVLLNSDEKRKRRQYGRLGVLLLAGLLIVCLAALPSLAHAQSTATLRCRLSAAEVTVGTETTLLIEVVDVVGLYAYELHMSYDDTGNILQITDNEGDSTRVSLGDFLDPDFVYTNELDTDANIIEIILTQIDPSPAVDGTGALAWATVSGSALGSVDFAFTDALLSGPDGEAIPVDLENCSLSVVPDDATSETPTPETPTPETPTPETPTPETPTPETPTPETPTPETPTPETPTPETPTPETPTPETPTPETPTPETPEATGSMAGEIFDDVNRNGIREPSEPGVSAIVYAYLLGTNRQWVILTEEDGSYSLNELLAGRYLVRVEARTSAEHVFTTASDLTLSLESGEGVSGVSFGIAFLDRFPYSPYPPRVFLPLIGEHAVPSQDPLDDPVVVRAFLPTIQMGGSP